MSVVRNRTIFRELDNSATILDGFTHGYHNLDIKKFVKIMRDIVAQQTYNLELSTDPQHEEYATSHEGRMVLVKVTFARRIFLEKEPPHLIVVQIKPNGALNEIYNGPGDFAWNAATIRKDKRVITIPKLKKIMLKVPNSRRIPNHESSSRPGRKAEAAPTPPVVNL